MGLNYSYEMWVLQERLYSFLELVNESANNQDGTILNWPDGRKLKFFASDIGYKGEHIHEVAFDTSFTGDLCASLFFEPDDVLRNSDYPYPLNESGKYSVGCIYISVNLSPPYYGWVDEETDCAGVSFIAASTDMSRAFQNSPSMRRFFIDLARRGGALSCTIDCEGNNDRLLFIDGRETNEECYAYSNLHDLRSVVSPEAERSESEHRLWLCRSTKELSQHDLLVRIEWAQHDNNAGIRAAACRSLAKSKISGVESLLCEIALKDKDWRVRYIAISCLSDGNSVESENVLFSLLKDENHQLQIVAIQTLRRRKSLRANLADELEKLVAKLSFRGPSMGAFLTAMEGLSFTWQTVGKSHHAQIIRQRMGEPDFPFQWEAQKAIDRLENSH